MLKALLVLTSILPPSVISDVDAVDVMREHVVVSVYNNMCHDNNAYPNTIARLVSEEQAKKYFGSGEYKYDILMTHDIITEFGCQEIAKRLAILGVM